MKKKMIAALLLLAMLLVSCGGGSEEPASSGDTSSVPSELSQGGNNNASSDRFQQIDAMYGEALDRVGKERYLLSTEKTATISREGQGDPSLLTDGEYVTDDKVSAAVHFSGKEEISVTLDMGERVAGIGDMGISLYTNMGMNASLPKHIEFHVSDDGESYTLIGTVYRSPETVLNESNLYLLSLQAQISFRYLKAVIPVDAFLSEETYIDEICVFGYRDAPKKEESMLTDNYYQNEPLPEVTEKEYWAETETDYSKEQNLVLNKPYRIMSSAWIDGIYLTDYYNTQPSNPALTNGKTGSNAYGDAAYFHFSQFLDRTIIFDLEKISGVSSVTVGLLSYVDVGIKLPPSVQILGSMDGKVWGVLATGTPTTTRDQARMDFTLSFEKTAARFLAVKTEVVSHLWMDEITVMGTKSVEDAVEKEFTQSENPMPNEFLSSDALGGTENIMLMYTFKNENPATGLNTVDELMPYVAYMDTEGNIKDSFFDAFLFLPCSTTCPSGGHLYYDAKNPSRASDWMLFEEDLFDPDHNVNALTKAVDRLDEALGTDTEMPVYFSIFSTVLGDKGFGDVDGDGKNEDFSNIEDRKKAIAWWIDRLEARFAAGEYDNLKLDGFYWYHEAIETSDPHEVELLKFTADYLHSKGYYFIWIPYYMASGFNHWKSYGFDAAVMQPNYMFHDDVEEERLYYNAEFAKQLGLGVEIEADYGVTNDPAKRDKYLAYLQAGVETGYMDSIKMYYQDGGPGVLYNAYKSSDPAYRIVYDYTYQYAKGTLIFGMDVLVDTTYVGKMGERLTVFPKGEDGKLVECVLAQAPRYGSVQQANNGRFYYYPAEGFTGTDTFVVCDPYNPDAPGTVITVVIE